MKKLLRVALCALLPVCMHSQEIPGLLWRHNTGGPFTEIISGIKTDAQGNLFATGTVQSPDIDFDPGEGVHIAPGSGTRGFFAKYDTDGSLLWSKHYTSTMTCTVEKIDFDAAGNIYTIGTFSGTADLDPGTGVAYFSSTSIPYIANDLFISKFDSEGNLIWVKAIQSSALNTKFITALAVDATGNMYVTGYQYGTVDFDMGPGVHNLTATGVGNAFIVKYDTNGDILWSSGYGSEGQWNIGWGIATDGDYVYATGTFLGTVDFDPGEDTYNLSSYGNYSHVYITKLTAAGNLVWAKRIGSVDNTDVDDLVLDSNSNVYITGSFNTPTDFDPGITGYTLMGTNTQGSAPYILKLKNDGNFGWAQGFNHGGGMGGYLAADAEDNIYASGTFGGTASFFPEESTTLTTLGSLDLYLVKFSPAGTPLWQKHLGTTEMEGEIWMAPTANNALFIGGNFEETLHFIPDGDEHNLTSAGMRDFFLAKYGFPEVSATGSFANDALRIYPNPSNGTVHIAVPDGLLGTQATLYNMAGQHIQTFALSESFSTTHLASGMYLLQVTSGKANYTAKIIVK